MGEVAGTPQRPGPKRLRLDVGKYFVNALLVAIRPTVGQALLAGTGALSAGASRFVSSAPLRYGLFALAIAMLVALALGDQRQRQRRRQRGADDSARELSAALSRLVAADGIELGPAFERDVLWLAALPLVASRQSRLALVKVEVGLAEVEGGEVRVLAASGEEVLGQLRHRAVVCGRDGSVASLLQTVARATWGNGHVEATTVFSGPVGVELVLVSSHPIAKEHARALVEMANTLRPALAMVRREAGQEVANGLR
jgi:hypothetical protein